MLPIFTAEDLFAKRQQWQHKNHASYFAMYSTLWGGICTDPLMWQVPLDDHLVHRSDGVFEAAKCVDGLVYCLDLHLERMESSCDFIQLPLPSEYENIKDIIKQCYQATKEKDALIRIMISRGPGSFTVSPYDSIGSQMYITVTRLNTPEQEKYEKGMKLISSSVRAKNQDFATYKTCAYLQNMLVKKSALDAQADYAVCFNDEGLMTEGATENIALITKDKELLLPFWSLMLRGTTLQRALAYGHNLVKEGHLKAVKNADITKEMLKNAAEIFVTSCSIDVLPVTFYDGQKVADGKPGKITKMLLECLQKESKSENTFTYNLKN